MKQPTAKQLAARARFAEMARSGALARKRKSAAKKKPTVSRKISQLRHEGYPQKQAVAIAMSEERVGKVKRNPLSRVRVSSPSQRTGAAPSKRLKSRRKATQRAPSGYYANPIAGGFGYHVSPTNSSSDAIAVFLHKKDAVEYAQKCADKTGLQYAVIGGAVGRV